jgi:hypothetical protein
MLTVSLRQGKYAVHRFYQGLRATRLKIYRLALRADQRTVRHPTFALRQLAYLRQYFGKRHRQAPFRSQRR